MGKSLPSPTRLQAFARLINHPKPTPKTSPHHHPPSSSSSSSSSKPVKMEDKSKSTQQQQTRIPLAMVVTDCARRWFQDTLKEAKGGDISMQVLVGQMYYSGYGIPRDAQKGKSWLTRASRSRSSVWKVGSKHPGYNASDSDSDELMDDKDV